MTLSRQQFIDAVYSATERTVGDLDAQCCGCGYVRHWIFRMNYGQWNPMLTEMDAELREVTTVEQLYEFLTSKA